MREKNEVPSVADFGLLRAYLAQHGASQQQIGEALGTSIAGRTRVQIAEQLRAWLRTRPKP